MRLRLLLATVIGLVVAMTGVASAQEEGGAEVTVTHGIDGLGPVDVAVEGLGTVIEDLDYSETAGPLAVAAGTYEVTVYAAGTTTPALITAEVDLEAGFAYDVTAVVVNDEATLDVEVSYLDSGTLVFEHDYVPGPSVTVNVLAFGDAENVVVSEVVAPGEELEAELPPGTHVLEIADEGGEDVLGTAEFTIETDEVTTVTATSILGQPAAPSPTPSATATASPTPIRTPNRVDTGAGGTEGNGGTTAALVLAGLAAGAVAVATTRKRAA